MNPFRDIREFTTKFEFDKEPFDLKKLMFRMELLEEEFDETVQATISGDAEEWVDGHIDLIVIAVGNLLLAGVDPDHAWEQVQRANMSKVRGIKKGREQSGGFDVIKPEGWVGPDHSNNHGKLDGIFKK